MGSSRGCLASSTTKAVINLVMEAMGAAISGLREYSTEESLWSTMSTELDLSFGSWMFLAPAWKARKLKEMQAIARIGKRRDALERADARMIDRINPLSNQAERTQADHM